MLFGRSPSVFRGFFSEYRVVFRAKWKDNSRKIYENSEKTLGNGNVCGIFGYRLQGADKPEAESG